MKRLITVLIISLTLFNLYAINKIARAEEMQDVVYLKNGSVIKGVIIEFIPNEKVKIQTVGGSIFVYTMDEIEKITKEPNQANTQKQNYSNSDDRKLIQLRNKVNIGRYGLFYSWLLTVAGSAAMGDGMIETTVLPVLGPFITIIRVESVENEEFLPGGKQLLMLSGTIQSSFAVYYVIALVNESNYKQTYGFKIQPSDENIGLKLTYNF